MAVAQLGDIFLGVTPAPARNYLSKAFAALKRQDQYKRLILPCCGRFAIVEIAVDAGWAPEEIEASDICLFSSLVGDCCAIGSTRNLGIRFTSERFEDLNKHLGTWREPGAVLWAMKVAQLNPAKVYTRITYDELWRGKDGYIDQLAGKVGELAAKLKGLRYQTRDLVDHCKSAIEDPQAVVMMNPPLYAGGYEKMWKMVGTEILWNEPKVPYFDVKGEIGKLYQMMDEADALTLTYRQTDPDGTVPEGVSERAVFANMAGKRMEYVTSNRRAEVEMIVQMRRETKIAPSRIPLLPHDHIITEHSSAEIVPTTINHAMYYRDLFAHKLGTTRSEGYYFVLVDGFIFGVFGTMYQKWLSGQNTEVFEVFGFNVPSTRYPRLNRLLMAVILTEDARQFYHNQFMARPLKDLTYFKTACIATVPEVKANRGLLDVLWRKTMPDGRYHIMYGSEFKPWSYNDAVRYWLGVQKKQQKITGKALGV